MLKLLERKFVVTHLLFRKYEKLFQQVLETSEVKDKAVSKQDAFKFGWLVFVVAKEKIVGDAMPDLVASLNVLICSLSFTLFNWEALHDPGVLALSRMCGCDAEQVAAVRQSLFDPLIYSLMQNGILATMGAPVTEDGRIRGFLLSSNVAANTASMEREYRRSPNICFDETRSLLSPSPPEGTPARSAFVSPQAALSPHTGLLKSIDLLESMVRHVHPEEPSAALVKYFASCGENEFLKTGRALLATVKERLAAERIDNVTERFGFVQKMYYLLLETLLRSEEDKLQQKGTNFSLLLSNEAFHRSLVWCACEIVFYSFRVERAFYPHTLAIAGVTALDLIKIIESVLRNLSQLSSVLVRRFSDIEEHLLEFLAWKRNEALYVYLETAGVREILSEWFGSDVPQTQPPPHQPQHPPAPLLQQQPHASPFGAQIAFASPVRSKPAAPASLSFGAKLFFRKISALVARRVDQLCSGLGMAFLIQSQICKTAMHAVLRTQLCFDRHLDQIILCAVYAVGKVYWKTAGSVLTGGQEITFKEIITCYKTLPHYTRLTPGIYRDVLISGDKRGSIIEFYNQLFVPELDEFVLRFQADYSHILGTPQALITPRSMRVTDVGAGLDTGGGGGNGGGTALGQTASFRNVSVSPMKSRMAQSPVSAFRATKLGFAGGKSPSKELAQISASMKGRRVEASPQRQLQLQHHQLHHQVQQQQQQRRKRLFRGGEEDEEEFNDDEEGGASDKNDDDEQPRRGSQDLMRLLRLGKELDEEPPSPKKKSTQK